MLRAVKAKTDNSCEPNKEQKRNSRGAEAI